MTAENRLPQTTDTKVKKASKQLASSTSAYSPLKRLVPVSSTKSTRVSFANSPPTSSSDSECARRGLRVGNAILNRKKSQGTKDDLEPVTFSTSEPSSETTSTEFEASNEISLRNTEPEETKCISTMAEPEAGLHGKELDVLNSNFAVNWFSLGGDDFDDFLKTKTDQNPDIAASEKPISLSCEIKAVDSPDSIHDDANNGHTDEFQGFDCRGYSITTSPQDKKSEDEKIEEELIIKTPDEQESSKRKNFFHQYEDEPTSSETSEGTSEALLQEHTQHAEASENRLHREGCGIDSFRGSLLFKVLLSSLFVLFTIWFSVRKLTEEQMDPPPT